MTALDLRSHAIQALGAFPDDNEARAVLRRAAEGDSALPVRLNAVRALGRMTHEDARGCLEALARTGTEEGKLAREILNRSR